MGKVAVQLKIMPNSPDVDLKGLSDQITSQVADYGRMYSCEVQPIAFGLKALIITIIVEDKEGGTEAAEDSIAEISEVESVQVITVTRML
ncbi:MAG: elongation factor 1-beta [Halobacteriota archaeon]